MKKIHQFNLSSIAGGEIAPGYPSPELMCTNTKLLVLSGYNKPGFDIGAGTGALMNMCPMDFWDPYMAHEYVVTGGGMTPNPMP